MLDHQVNLSKEPLTCPRCGSQFTCGLANGESHCWCFDLPHKVPLPKAQAQKGCLCPNCLQQVMDEIAAQEKQATP
ncbi:MAG: cysteine-rich CWC family protein [Anaerolineae bacterium]|nr:cysteine-rich CWC family protein [Anaerolineae bacterium]